MSPPSNITSALSTSFSRFFHSDGGGYGGFDLKSTDDHAFVYDYEGSGKADHLALYRPGSGAIYIVRRDSDGPLATVYPQGNGGSGIGGYDLQSQLDRAFAYDYDSSGKLDHIVLYRHTSGAISIVRKDSNGSFSAVYAQGDGGSGIGGCDLKWATDRMFAFDYDGSGKLDHLVLYRSGRGNIWILKNSGGTFNPVYQQDSGIGGYDLKNVDDRAFAYDYDSSGKLDHIVLYRPGRGAIYIVRKDSSGSFSAVYTQADGGSGIGGYDLKKTEDQVFAFDYDGSGKLDHLVLYRPGRGAIYIVQKDSSGGFSAVYQQGDGGSGIGGYDLKSSKDQALAFDFVSNNKQNFITLYRPGTGTIWVVKRE